MPLPKEKIKVFLSHSQADRALTYRMIETLDRLHIRTFAYEYYYVGGVNRFELIKHMIANTEYFVVLLTSNGLKSQWVNQEIGYAVGIGKAPIPILEVNPKTRRRLGSRGFVELHDPILFNPLDPGDMIRLLVYTFYGWLTSTRSWPDKIWLTCKKCENEFDEELDYSQILSHPEMREKSWECPKCGNSLKIGFPGFELHFLE